jgi:hypothetical protein
MTLPRTVADVVTDHVVFEVECIDRMYLNVYVPGLQYAAGIVGYVHRLLGLPIASTAPLGRMTEAFGAAMRRFAYSRLARHRDRSQVQPQRWPIESALVAAGPSM